jgi:hypothetical protein
MHAACQAQTLPKCLAARKQALKTGEKCDKSHAPHLCTFSAMQVGLAKSRTNAESRGTPKRVDGA